MSEQPNHPIVSASVGGGPFTPVSTPPTKPDTPAAQYDSAESIAEALEKKHTAFRGNNVTTRWQSAFREACTQLAACDAELKRVEEESRELKKALKPFGQIAKETNLVMPPEDYIPCSISIKDLIQAEAALERKET